MSEPPSLATEDELDSSPPVPPDLRALLAQLKNVSKDDDFGDPAWEADCPSCGRAGALRITLRGMHCSGCGMRKQGVRAGPQKWYAKLPLEVLYHPSLSLLAKLVFACLMDHVRKNPQKRQFGKVWYTQKQMADALGMSQPAVSSAVKELKRANLIKQEYRVGRKPQAHRSSVYSIPWVGLSAGEYSGADRNKTHRTKPEREQSEN
jgi:DNA-binding transcriptional ArsR family regulator